MPSFKHKKSKILVRALQFTGDNAEDIIGYFGFDGCIKESGTKLLSIICLDGIPHVTPGQWIVYPIDGNYSVFETMRDWKEVDFARKVNLSEIGERARAGKYDPSETLVLIGMIIDLQNEVKRLKGGNG